MKPYLSPFFSLLMMIAAWTMPGQAAAQTGCPGCQVSLPPLAEDTLYLPPLPDGIRNQVYDNQISFRMPKSTTPVAAIDGVTPPGLPISKIEILGIDGIPAGLNWQPSQTSFDLGTQTDGCIRMCGTPLEADTFIMTVRLKATVLIATTEASFPLRLIINPSVATTGGFSMTNTTGCGTATVSFTNEIPSNGQPGYSYQWNFGDGTSFSGENPLPHTYSAPGTYNVGYTAVLDTFGYTLTGMRILSGSCDDQLGLGKPDVYAIIKNPAGVEVFNSSPHIENVTFPLTLPANLKIGPGNYTLEVYDEDSGAQGGDDLCGAVSFNILSDGVLVSGGFSVELFIIHPVDTVNGTGTVTVYPIPTKPFIDAPQGSSICEENAPILLVCSTNGNLLWTKDGAAITAAINDSLLVDASGGYQVQVTSSNGCTAVSEPKSITINPSPDIPLFGIVSNLLYFKDSLNLPPGYGLQWARNNDNIPGATGFTYCADDQPGFSTFSLTVINFITSCLTSYSEDVVILPDTYCYPKPAPTVFNLYPNPAPGLVTIQLSTKPVAATTVQVWNIAGSLMQEKKIAVGEQIFTIGGADWPVGVYVVRLEDNGERVVRRFIVSD